MCECLVRVLQDNETKSKLIIDNKTKSKFLIDWVLLKSQACCRRAIPCQVIQQNWDVLSDPYQNSQNFLTLLVLVYEYIAPLLNSITCQAIEPSQYVASLLDYIGKNWKVWKGVLFFVWVTL